VLGFAIGMGLLAKYAMIYILFGLAGAALVDPATRAMWRNSRLWLALVIAFLIVTPNIVWNVSNDFATFRHTEGNIRGGGLEFNPLGGVIFVVSQFGVVGPVLFAVFLFAILGFARLQLPDRILVMFALPPLALVTAVAFATSAKANWAAPSAISLTIVAVALLVRQARTRWLYLSVAFGAGLQLILMVTDTVAYRVSLPLLSNGDIYHRTLGWKSISESVKLVARANSVKTVAAEQNAVVASLVYYLRDQRLPILAWPNESVATNQFELDRPLTAAAAEPVLFISDRPTPERLSRYYSQVDLLEPIFAATGPHSSRRFYAFKLAGVRQEFGPLRSLHP